MYELFQSDYFGLALSLLVFAGCAWVQRKTKIVLLNPLLVSSVIIIALLKIAGITYEQYQNGAALIQMFLVPVTAALALSIYRQRMLLKKYLPAVLAGCTAGALTSVLCVSVLCKVFGLEDDMLRSLVSKSVTTPIAVDLTEALGGISSITVAAVVLTGIMGAVLAPVMIKLFRVKDPVAQGVGIGASSHALGTSKALELGEAQGAMSGVSIGITGVITAVLVIILF